MIRRAAVVNDDGVCEQVIMVDVDADGEIRGMKGHPMERKLQLHERAEIGMERGADGLLRRPVEPGPPEEPGAP